MTEFFGAWSGTNDDGEIEESVETVETVTTTTTRTTRKKAVEPEDVSPFYERGGHVDIALDRDWCGASLFSTALWIPAIISRLPGFDLRETCIAFERSHRTFEFRCRNHC